MKFIVNCPHGTKEECKKNFEEANFFDSNDRVVFIAGAVDRVYVEVLPEY